MGSGRIVMMAACVLALAGADGLVVPYPASSGASLQPGKAGGLQARRAAPSHPPRARPSTAPRATVRRIAPRRSPPRGGQRARRRMVDLLREMIQALQGLQGARAEVRRVLTARRAAQGEIRRLDGLIQSLRGMRRGTQRALDARQETIRRRVRALYRLVRQTAFRPILDPRRARIPADGRAALIRVLRRDQAEARHLRAEVLRVEAALSEARDRHRQAVALLRDLDRRWDVASARVARLEQRISGLHYERKHFRGGAHEWTREALRLEKRVVALLVAQQRKREPFERLRGKLLRPVPGMIVRWFGEARVPGEKATERCRGVEISALPRWKVRAPATGVVRFSGRVAGRGTVLVLDHGAGFLSVLAGVGIPTVRPGQRVAAGGVVATMVGRRKGRPVRVYYELRRGTEPLDPVPWLRGGLAERAKRLGSKGRRGPASRRRPPASAHQTTVLVERTP